MTTADSDDPDQTPEPGMPDRPDRDTDRSDGVADPLGNWLDKHAPPWLRQARHHPRHRPFYRAAVAVIGALFLILAALTGWLPGPGGIPLALLGLTILATEFHWARRILGVAERGLYWCGWHWARIGRLGRTMVVIGCVLCACVGIWLGLLVTGVPGWMPGPLAEVLTTLPGVQ